jgi:hypothetical protein
VVKIIDELLEKSQPVKLLGYEHYVVDSHGENVTLALPPHAKEEAEELMLRFFTLTNPAESGFTQLHSSHRYKNVCALVSLVSGAVPLVSQLQHA